MEMRLITCCDMKTSFRYVLLLLLAMGTTHAQDTIIPLWTAPIPNRVDSGEVEIREEQDILRISKVQLPDIAVYLPSKAHNTGMGVLVFPGGGYHILAYDWEGTDVAKWLNSKGIAAFVVKYRLPVSRSLQRPYEVPLMDAQRALRLVRATHEAWGISPDKIGVMGFSAGGHLASSLGTLYGLKTYEPRDPADALSARPDFMALVYPVISFTSVAAHSGSRKALLGDSPLAGMLERYSTELQITPDTPPAILFHANDDEGVSPENSLLFYRGLLKNKVPAALHIYPRGGHGFSLSASDPYLHRWTDDFVLWLQDQWLRP